MARLAVRSLVVACVTALSVVGAWSLRAAAEEAAEKAKEEEAKAQAAQKAAADALAAVTATTQVIETSKKTINDSTEGLKKIEADVMAFAPEVQKAADAFAAVNTEWVTKQR